MLQCPLVRKRRYQCHWWTWAPPIGIKKNDFIKRSNCYSGLIFFFNPGNIWEIQFLHWIFGNCFTTFRNLGTTRFNYCWKYLNCFILSFVFVFFEDSYFLIFPLHRISVGVQTLHDRLAASNITCFTRNNTSARFPRPPFLFLINIGSCTLQYFIVGHEGGTWRAELFF